MAKLTKLLGKRIFQVQKQYYDSYYNPVMIISSATIVGSTGKYYRTNYLGNNMTKEFQESSVGHNGLYLTKHEAEEYRMKLMVEEREELTIRLAKICEFVQSEQELRKKVEDKKRKKYEAET